MSEYVLFSPLGMSDPTRGCHDGAFIHICRFYKPRKVYMYMSAEVCQYDEFDNRYEAYLQRLCKKLGFECEVEKIKKHDLVNVHEFDTYYRDFSECIQKCIDENPGCSVIVNLSSGSPQMKAALYTVCSLSNHKILPIQVSTPEGKSNKHMPEGFSYDIELEWECNEDNDDSLLENRCRVVKNENYNALIKSEIIKKHISAYDYNAALIVAETIPNHIDSRAVDLMLVGKYRQSLEIDMATKIAQRADFDLIPIKDRKNWIKKIQTTFEYILVLQNKRKRGELADLIRGISPVLTTMYEVYLNEKCNIDINQYLEKQGKTLKLSRKLLAPDLLSALDSKFSPEFSDSEPCAANLSVLISSSGDAKAAQLANKLREIEDKARNIAAHEIVAVTDEWIKQRTGYTTDKILKMLREFFSYCIAVPKDAWNSYEELNEQIISSM